MRLPGRCADAVNGKVNWVPRSLGKMAIPFEDLRVYLPAREGRTASQAAEELEKLLAKVGSTDTVYMTSGDVVGGVVDSLGPETLGFGCKMGKLKLATATLAGLTFSNTLKPYAEPTGTYARLNLVDGSVLAGSVSSTGQKFSITGLAGKFEVARSDVASVDFANTKLVGLADLEPAFVKETGWFDHVWRWQRDRSVWGRPLTIGTWTYRRGIGMHAKCQLDYDLAGKYRMFLTDVGIDGETAGAGECVVVVYGDGKPLTEAMNVKGSTGPRQLRLDVSTVKRLSLLADFGDNTDAGDHVTWGNARLVKK
jgi:hypothetical protein